MRLVDTHAHLDFPQLKKDLGDVLSRARGRGVEKVVTVGIDEASSMAALKISTLYPGMVYPTLGLHPHDAKAFDRSLAQRYHDLLKNGGFVAVGETGLDYAKEYSPRNVQKEAFSFQLGLARHFGLPVIVHTRDADQDTMDILRAEAGDGLRGVIHCFSSGQRLIEVALDLGFYISFSGMITFSWADGLRRLVDACPVERLLVETDSPFLAPVPHRGRANEPQYVYYVAREIARIRGMDLEEVAWWTTKNAVDLFGNCLS